MDNNKQNIKSILKEIFPSEEMASYLAGCSLKQWQIRDAVAYAAIPLERKRDVFLQLASGKDRHYFRHQAGCIEQAIREMQPKPGEFFYLKSHRYFEEDGSGKLQNDYDYEVLGSEVCYFSSNKSSDRDWDNFSIYHDLNLPVPFRAGDIVTVDCR